MYVYNKKYLRDLKIEHNYLKRFINDKASATLKSNLNYALICLEAEIRLCENCINEYYDKLKKQQITIFDIEIVGVNNE